MITTNLRELTLLNGWFEDDSTYRNKVAFPMYRSTGTADSAMVYFEIEPGDALREHTDSAEEIILVLEGILQGNVGEETTVAGPGTVLLIPQMVPHGFRNVGTETAKVVGFFASSQVSSVFPVPMMPLGQREAGAPPIPAERPLTWNQIAAILTKAPQG